jgi:hypothetical protein
MREREEDDARVVTRDPAVAARARLRDICRPGRSSA